MLNYSAADARYEPYPLVVLRPSLDAKAYDELCDNFPDISLFGPIRGYEYKLSLSEKFAADNYHKFIRKTVEFLKQKNIDLDIDKFLEPTSKRIGRALGEIRGGRFPSTSPRL